VPEYVLIFSRFSLVGGPRDFVSPGPKPTLGVLFSKVKRQEYPCVGRESVWGRRGIIPFILGIGIRRQSAHGSTNLLPWKEFPYPQTWEVSGPRSQSGRYGEGKKLLPLLLNEKLFLCLQPVNNHCMGTSHNVPCSHGERRVHLYSLLTSALERGGWLTPRPDRFTPRKAPRNRSGSV